jgi:hypothetical protein
MTLHTAEVPIPTDLPVDLGGYQSPPNLKTPIPSAHSDGIHTRQTFRSDSESLDMDEKARKAGMRVEDMKIIIDANGQYLELRSDTVKTAAKQHTELAVVVRPAFILSIISIHLFSKVAFRCCRQNYSHTSHRTQHHWLF